MDRGPVNQGGGLAAARAAYARRDWSTARVHFLDAAAAGELEAADRYALSQCAWWLGDIAEAIDHLEVAYGEAMRRGDGQTAATMALELGVNQLLQGDGPIASGWLARARRLAADVPECPLHGYLAFVLEVEPHFRSIDSTGVLAAARRVQDIGRRFHDPTLVAAGLNGEGRELIRQGRVDAGMALLDEAMVAVSTGEVADEWAGNLYCNAIAVCHELADFRRMAGWTEATERWLATLPAAVLFAGICRVHRVQLHRLHGDWQTAEQEAAQVCEDLADVSVFEVGEAWYEIAEVRRRQGDVPGAKAAYARAHDHGRDPQPGLALLHLTEGRFATTAAALDAALQAAGTDRLARAALRAAQVDAAVAAGDLELADRASAELTETADACASPGLAAMAATATGKTLLAKQRSAQALPVLRRACRGWRELDAPYETARTRVLLAQAYRALGDHDANARELDAAAAVFEQLGARRDTADVHRLRGAATRPAGLSDRELEVLRLLARGSSNAEIGEALFISPKTVARHLSNIFTKLGVASRTQAARYAFDHGLLAPPAP